MLICKKRICSIRGGKVQKLEGGGTNNRMDCLFLLRFSFLKFGKLGEGAGHGHLGPPALVMLIGWQVKLALTNVNDFFKLLRHKGISSYRVRYLQMKYSLLGVSLSAVPPTGSAR